MTSLVAIKCLDGVVIGADSAVTFGAAGGNIGTIEHHTSKKLKIVGSSIVIAGAGELGLMQRFVAAVEKAEREGRFAGIDDAISFGKALSSIGLRDFNETHLEKFNFTALVAFIAGGEPNLCELDGLTGFQPEIKELVDLWHVSTGVGQSITDPFLALLREAFWSEAAPNLQGGIFTALWALTHVCKLNTGGIGFPINLAVLERPRLGHQPAARILSAQELAEHGNVVEAAMRHLGEFKNILMGRSGAEEVPTAAASAAAG
jgi:hypothetical protein